MLSISPYSSFVGGYPMGSGKCDCGYTQYYAGPVSGCGSLKFKKYYKIFVSHLMKSAFKKKVNRIDYGSSTTCAYDCQCAQLTSYTTGNAYVRLNMRCTTTCVQCNPGVACTTYSCSSNCRCPTYMYWTNMAMGCRMRI